MGTCRLRFNLAPQKTLGMSAEPELYQDRKSQIFHDYLQLVDSHLADVLAQRREDMWELQDFAGALCIHPTHLSNVIKEYTGNHPCFFYEQKLVAVAKDLLNDGSKSIAQVAALLTFDPSNFTKWFKAQAGITPSQYRKQLAAVPVQIPRAEQKPELATI